MYTYVTCQGDRARRTNAAFLLGAYCVMIEGWAPEEAAACLDRCGGRKIFPPYQDATYCESTYDLTGMYARARARTHTQSWTATEGS